MGKQQGLQEKRVKKRFFKNMFWLKLMADVPLKSMKDECVMSSLQWEFNRMQTPATCGSLLSYINNWDDNIFGRKSRPISLALR